MKKNKIVFIRPNYRSHLITPPLGLGYLSSFLRAKGYETQIIDALNLDCSPQRIAELCEGADIVAINCLSSYFLETIELSKILKEQGFTIVIGGAHATALPELTLKETHADYLIVGEGELSLSQLVECIKNNKPVDDIPGVMTDVAKKTIKSPLIENLDALPFPDWRQIDPRAYKKAPHGGLVKSFPVAPIISSRGCPFECTFCASPFLSDRKIRFRSPENVVDEIEYLVNKFDVKEIHFEDDNLTLNRKHVEGICELLLRRNIKVNWATPNGVRVDTMDLELLKLMKKSGCYFIAFGVESGNQDILNRVKKRTSLEMVEKAVKLAKKTGIITQGFFIFGLPGETEQTIRETIKYARKLPLDKAQFLILDVLPGSQLWNEKINSQLTNWSHKSYQEATWVPEGLTREKLNLSPGYAFRSFFFRPKQILFVLKYFKFSQIPFIIKRAIDFNIFPFLSPFFKSRSKSS